VLSLPFQKAIIAGRFPRDLAHPVYGRRRLYGLCWTCVYYCKPVYYICLTVPLLKAMLFRLFGYRGSLNFTVYPDTWIRDLPLLDFGEGAYVSNRATLGTNLVLGSGKILVDRITLGPGSVFGHLSQVAPGFVLGEGAEIGAGVDIGLSVRVGDGALVQPSCALNHYSSVGADTVLGATCYVDTRVEIGPKLNIPAAAVVPARARIKTVEDVMALFSAKTVAIRSRGASPAPADSGAGA
jgi:UDP-3-O-[3-hydroxymyristoyl] glucosamine N-acyltransferase